MTWNEVRLAALQKMFSSDGPVISENDEAVQQYLAAMPQAANEAAGLLCAAGFGLRRTRELAAPEGGRCTVDLTAALPGLYPGDPVELYRQKRDGSLAPVTGAALTAGRYLELPGTGGEPLLAVYTQAPQPFGPDTPADAPIELQPRAAVLMPLYMASQLYKDDDITIATQYRNEFEAALEALPRGSFGMIGGGFSGVSGWV